MFPNSRTPISAPLCFHFEYNVCSITEYEYLLEHTNYIPFVVPLMTDSYTLH